jgi:trehalose monomycolate/heme transporter
VVLYRSATMTVQDPAYRQAVTAALARIPAADVTRTSTYWSSGQPGMVAAGGHATYVVLHAKRRESLLP